MRFDVLVLSLELRLVVTLLLYSSITTASLATRSTTSNLCTLLDDGVTDCSRRGLSYIPRNIASSTKVLLLDGNQIQVIESDDFPALLPDLEELVLSDNLISSIDTSTFCHKLPALRILRLTSNKLKTLPDLRHCKSLKELHSSGNLLDTINGRHLDGLASLEKLDLSKNNLTRLNSSHLPVNTSLKHLIIHGNNIETIYPDVFINVITLEKLRLSKNKLTQIPKDLFRNLTSLQTLDLSRNRLTTIEHRYFTGLVSVRTINLAKNRLNYLNDGSFYECGLLDTLNLEANSLTSVKEGPLFGLKSLRQLILRRNNITEIDPSTWTQANSIRQLDLSRNKLEVIRAGSFSKAGNIRELNLADNNIYQIEEGAFNELSNLQTLDLSSNQLSDSLQSSTATVFKVLSRLLTLDLSNNRLQTISVKLLDGLHTLNTLSLQDNPVTTIESHAFTAPLNLTRLELKSDKLVCDCKMSWLAPWLRLKGMTTDVLAKCSLPLPLRARNIFEISPEDFRCDDGQRSPIPLITRHIRPTTALRGSNVTLTCIATTNSNSNVTVEWRKDNKIIPTSTGKIVTDATTADGQVSMYTTYLNLIKVNENDQGSYQCGFKNEYGSDYSDKAELQVLVFPSFTNTPSNVVVKKGQDAKLLCEATGYPAPYLSWSKDGGENFPAARDGRIQVNPNNINEFIIKNVERQDHGIYYCNATNIAGSIISNATIDVMIPPMFTEPISCTNTTTGTYVLKCRADGNPKTPIVWYKDGEIIEANEKYLFSQSRNNLLIIESSVEDSGVYTCSASNTLGQVTQQCQIVIQDTVPKAADTVTKPSVKSSGVLDQSTITGLIIIAVVCCIVGTSLIWVVIIYQTRRRRSSSSSSRYASKMQDGANVPLSGFADGQAANGKKLGDCNSSSDGSSQSKSDSFLEYRSSQDSPSAFCKLALRYQTIDSELASAMEPLNPSQQESQDSLPVASSSVPPHHHHHRIAHCHTINHHEASPSSYHQDGPSQDYVSHPFSTFQPTRHHKLASQQYSCHRPAFSKSSDNISSVDARRAPYNLTQMLQYCKAPPTHPPQAVVAPVHMDSSTTPTSMSMNRRAGQFYEEPAYMNLPQSAVTPKRSNIEENSDYMNIEPRDVHIYQNPAILNIQREKTMPMTGAGNTTGLTTVADVSAYEIGKTDDSDVEDRESTNPRDSSTTDADDDSSLESLNDVGKTDMYNAVTCDVYDQSHTKTPKDTNSHANKSKPNSYAKPSNRGGHKANNVHNSRREGLADSSFVERKYGLFTENFLGSKGSEDSRTTDVSEHGRNSRSDL